MKCFCSAATVKNCGMKCSLYSNTCSFKMFTCDRLDSLLLHGVFRLKVIQVTGKRNRPVPILLTEDMSSCMQVLHDLRSQCGVCDGNQFFFALPRSANSHLYFFSVLQRVATAANMKKPQNLTTTRLRKHLATAAQVGIAL